MLNAKITAWKCAQNTVDIGALHTKQYRSYIRTCSLLKNKMRLEVIYHISSCTFFSPTDVYYTTEFVFYVAGKCYDKNIDPSQQKIYRGRASLSTRWQHAIWWWWQENTCVASTMTRLQTSHDTHLACHAYCACGCQHAFVFHLHMHATSATIKKKRHLCYCFQYWLYLCTYILEWDLRWLTMDHIFFLNLHAVLVQISFAKG